MNFFAELGNLQFDAMLGQPAFNVYGVWQLAIVRTSRDATSSIS